MLYLVQLGSEGDAQDCKKQVEEWEDKVKKNEEHLKKLESEKKKREQYEGELGVVLLNSVNTMQADLYTHTRLGQFLSPYTVCAQCVVGGGDTGHVFTFSSHFGGYSSLQCLILLIQSFNTWFSLFSTQDV